MSKDSGLKYLIFSFLFIIITAYKSFNLELISDNLNYFQIYNNIKSNPLPFNIELITSSLMYLCNTLGLDFYQYTFLKVLIVLPVLIKLDLKITQQTKSLWSLLFLFSFLSPPMIGTMIFLTRQSFSLCFLFLAIMCNRNFSKSFNLVLMLLTHVGSIIWIPFLIGIKRLNSILLSKKTVVLSIILLVVAIVTKFDVTTILVSFLSNASWVPDFLAHNLAMKRDFYAIHDSTEFDSLSILNTSISIIAIFTSLFFIRNGKLDKYSSPLVCLYHLSFLLFALTYTNAILATRVGFLSYFFCVQFLFLFTYLSFSNKKNTSPDNRDSDES